MVTVNPSTDTSEFTVLAQANLSITAERLMLFYIVLSLGSLMIALGLSLIGYWPVLIFAVVHQLMVGALLWHSWRRQWVKEWITLNPEHAQVIHVDHHGRQLWQVDSHWVRLVWEEPQLPQHRTRRLFLKAQANQTEIGAFLNESERQELAQVLAPAITQVSMLAP